ncbi:UDP-4-amino-4,6-dideoxy-N-acetyl-beta-L-altrosamine transaminase [Balneolaceae bacterium]|nr:UDP-4-amino-4,6-dideoxy-N-acetyl-beta-L-altrosamine transaminase [Balneolaceae bacterium]
MINSIPYGKQNITEEDVNAVVKVLKSDYLTQGPKIKEFEDSFAKYVGAKYAVAVSNGTAALHLCTMALNVKHGQKVITSPITFAASANCVRFCGGEVVFGDIDPETYLLDISSVQNLLKSSPKGTYSGIIPVDFSGRAVNLEEYRELADEYGLWIIEDACHAPGGSFLKSNKEKSKCGSGEFADLAIFSFHPVKHITAGEGGMITTNDEILFKKLLTLRTHGIVKDDRLYLNSSEFASGVKSTETFPLWYMEMQELGYNYRLTDIQAALGLSQLQRAETGIMRRREIASLYNESFEDKSFIIRQSGIIEGHAYHLYIIEVEYRLRLYNFLRANKIYSQIHYIPCHLMPYYRNLGWQEGDCSYSEKYYKRCISLPIYPNLSKEEQSFVINKVIEFFNNEVY